MKNSSKKRFKKIPIQTKPLETWSALVSKSSGGGGNKTWINSILRYSHQKQLVFLSRVEKNKNALLQNIFKIRGRGGWKSKSENKHRYLKTFESQMNCFSKLTEYPNIFYSSFSIFLCTFAQQGSLRRDFTLSYRMVLLVQNTPYARYQCKSSGKFGTSIPGTRNLDSPLPVQNSIGKAPGSKFILDSEIPDNTNLDT